MEEVAEEFGAKAETIVFLDHFRELPDPRQRGKVLYPLDEILLLCLLAVLAGAETFVDIALFGQMKLEFLRRFRPFRDSTPSHDHLGDIFASLDAGQFQRCFAAWVASVTGVPVGVIALDGKTSRRSYQKKNAKAPIHMVAAFAARQRLVLGQVKVAEKSNEIVAIPRSCYDEGKRCAETLFFDYQRQHGLKIKVARIFNTYGPYMRHDDGRVVSNFIWQALLRDDITLFGTGLQTRSFCYVTDMIEGLQRLMNSPGNITGPINIGNPREFTMRELAERILAITGSKSKIVSRPLPEDDPRQRQPDIALAEKLLGWRPTIQLDEGLRHTIAYFETLLHEHGTVRTLDVKLAAAIR